MSETFHGPQRVVQCPNCPRTIRLHPSREKLSNNQVRCGNCEHRFDPDGHEL